LSVEEARLEQTEGGLEPAGPGWFVVSVRDATWWSSDAFGAWCAFEGEGASDARFSEFGFNISVVWPGGPSCMYHGEDAQEDMLVLAGECLLIVEGEERLLQAWDFVHLPPDTRHVLVGAGDRPCAILMVGTRKDPEAVLYPFDEVARKHGAGVDVETPDPGEAYARFTKPRREPLEDAGLPWQ
jgi:uncharacterized cupin superfamily protein